MAQSVYEKRVKEATQTFVGMYSFILFGLLYLNSSVKINGRNS